MRRAATISPAALAGRVPLPDMQRAGSLGHGARLASLSGVRWQTSVTAGTLFADTHLPLRLWFEALWHVTSQKGGASALGLQRVLGLGELSHGVEFAAQVAPGDGSPPDATGCKVLSKSMRFSSAGRDQASEGAGAGQSAGRDCRTTGGQRDRPHPAERVADASASSLEPAIAAAIELGSQVRTDDWRGYSGLDRLGYRRQIARSSAEVGDNLCHWPTGWRRY